MRIETPDLLEVNDALSLALEALTYSRPSAEYYETARERHASAINAVRDAIAILSGVNHRP